MIPSQSQNHSQQQIQPLPPRSQPLFQAIRLQTLLKIFIFVVLLSLLVLVLYLFSQSLQQTLIKSKKMSIPSDSLELSGIDQTTFRSYYYFQEMKKMAKDNVKYKRSIKVQKNAQIKKFENITFWQLYGLFKVVKAIQFANNFTHESKQLQDKTEAKLEKEEQLLANLSLRNAYYNYTNYFSMAKNQYKCGSCYSFPITATIEFLYRRYLNISVKLSEQQLIDCTSENDTVNGCNSGNITKGFEYAMRVGLVDQDAYPYRSRQGESFNCRKDIIQNPNITKYRITNFTMIPKGKCQLIQQHLSEGHTIASMINAQDLSGYKISSGPFRNCKKDSFNHAVTIVGQTKNKQWIIRNSWGSSWGNNGYFLIKGGNTCGICTHAIVPNIQPDILKPK